jgi:hypothetical protein
VRAEHGTAAAVVRRRLRALPGSAGALFDWESLLAGSKLSPQGLRRFAVAEID